MCVVPASQRRIVLPKEGCSCCGCRGCTKEDRLIREREGSWFIYIILKSIKDRERREDKDSISKRSDDSCSMKNGCCKKCMKAFSANGRVFKFWLKLYKKDFQACLCQVPKLVRKTLLPPEGCSFCGCSGKIIAS